MQKSFQNRATFYRNSSEKTGKKAGNIEITFSFIKDLKYKMSLVLEKLFFQDFCNDFNFDRENRRSIELPCACCSKFLFLGHLSTHGFFVIVNTFMAKFLSFLCHSLSHLVNFASFRVFVLVIFCTIWGHFWYIVSFSTLFVCSRGHGPIFCLVYISFFLFS